ELADPVWAAPWQSPWPADHSDPLVAVGFSSTYQAQEPIVRRTIEALGSMKVRGLVTLGPSLKLDMTPPPNVVVCETAPHSRVFPLASAVVTHCGHGTVARALAAGVPIVGVPMGRDQNDTAARVVARGVGVRVAMDASADKIRAAISRVLQDPSH